MTLLSPTPDLRVPLRVLLRPLPALLGDSPGHADAGQRHARLVFLHRLLGPRQDVLDPVEAF